MPTYFMAQKILIFTIFFCYLAPVTLSDFAADQKECGSQLASLAACLPFVKGSANIPVKDCCAGLQRIHLNSPKCLCVLIKDSSDPQLGLTINLTLALELPVECNVNTNVSRCPALLNISPNSTEARIFNTNNTSSGPETSPAANSTANSTSTSSNKNSSHQLKHSMYWPGSELLFGLAFVIFSFYKDTLYISSGMGYPDY